MKKIIAGLLLTTVALTSIGTVSAVDPNEVTGTPDGKGGKSHGYVKLEAGDGEGEEGGGGVTEPAKPTDPSGETGNEGVLTIDHVAILNFGSQKLSGKKVVYSNIVGAVNSPNVQVTDKRGTEEGWRVMVSQTPFVDVTPNKGGKELAAQLTLPAGTIESVDASNVSLPPVSSEVVEVNASPSLLMKASPGVETPGVPTKGQGAGTWINSLPEAEIKLAIPAGNTVGEYISTMTWSLMDAPA
ncbi:conserved exported hypothetical protein [Carnobacterium maltaromaticum]|uniref:WxL domain-containing protein n=1 Tax=Carnobacterium maltaromaticum TaxID=2751 RepID=UPI00191BB716|nr:WxL domain-containing protein [Carnobacterium maltaromaticum]CAD5898794.1 conserved exported hypothetical protein [Carnobacterium maltaromaticum]